MKKTGFILFVLSVLFYSCSDHITPDFSYSPTSPRCGQVVTFTNLTTGDDDWTAKSWNWDFGDNGTSTSKSPTHIFRKAGVYTVSLKVDSAKKNIKSLDVIVYDSIPTIIADVDSVKFYQNITFSALIYNPNGYDITYEWSFSSNAVSTDLTTDKFKKSTATVFFTKRDMLEEVKLKVTVGDSTYNVKSEFKVYDNKAKSILMAQKNGKILRQRIYNNGLESYTQLPVSSGKHPFSLCTYADNLYVFDAGSSINYNPNWLTDTSGDGSIFSVDLKDYVTTNIANNQNSSSHFGFFNGYVDNQNIYWTDYSEFVYQTRIDNTIGNFQWKGNVSAQTSVPYYKTNVNRLGYYGKGLESDQLSGGIQYFDMAYFWAKGGSGRGIYRFQSSDILSSDATASSPLPSLGAILSGFAIRAFAIDEINMKIYFSVTAPADKVGFWVSNLNGSNPQQIEAAPMDAANMYITGIAIDNESNKVYWAYRSPELIGASAPDNKTWEEYYQIHPTYRTGVKMAALATTYKPAGSVGYFLQNVAVYGLAIDKVKR